MSINRHIIENLNFYLKLDNPEYAFLVTGDWGIGKTHFIKSFINDHKSTDKKFVIVSLFGLSKTSQINEKIFEALHPVLGSKYAKAAGNLIKGALSLGFRIDANSDGNSETTVSSKFEKVNLADLISGLKNNPSELIIVFDDLERTSIPLSEALGFINYMVEISGIKVIIAANETALFEGENSQIYTRFKEKVIGKTFEVNHEIDEFLKGLLDNRKHTSFDRCSEIIKRVYSKSKYRNLRNIKQTLDDFEFLASFIEEKYLKNDEFYSLILSDFISLSLEVKNGKLTKEELYKNIPFRFDAAQSNTNDIYRKYFSDHTSVFNGALWCSIIFKNDLLEVNTAISRLAYFVERQEVISPDWVKLWNFRLLEDEEFKAMVEKLEEELNSLIETDLRIYIHQIALMIFFSKNALTKISIDQINNIVNRYIDKYRGSDSWKNNRIPEDSQFNGTGYAYYNSPDPEFITIKNSILRANEKAYNEELLIKRQSSLKEFVKDIERGDVDSINEFILKTYDLKPIFNEIPYSDVASALIAADNKTITAFGSAISSRYSSNHLINDQPKYSFLKKELEFWVGLENILTKPSENPGTVKNLLINSFVNSVVKEVIMLLSEA